MQHQLNILLRFFILTDPKTVVKHMFYDMQGATCKTAHQKPLKMYGKPCRYELLYGNVIF